MKRFFKIWGAALAVFLIVCLVVLALWANRNGLLPNFARGDCVQIDDLILVVEDPGSRLHSGDDNFLPACYTFYDACSAESIQRYRIPIPEFDADKRAQAVACPYERYEIGSEVVNASQARLELLRSCLETDSSARSQRAFALTDQLNTGGHCLNSGG